MKDLKVASDTLGLNVQILAASTENEVLAAFDKIAGSAFDVLLIAADPFLTA